MPSPRGALTPLALEILALLHERPMHPYEMQQLMRERQVDRRVKLRAGSLYHTVERLEAAEQVDVVDTQREGRRPERTVYAITEAGRDAFTDRVREMLSRPSDEYVEYPVALSAMDDMDPADAINQLRSRETRLEAQLAADTAVVERLRARDLPRMYWIDIDFQRARRQFELEWTRSLLRELDSGSLRWPDEQGTVLSVVTDEEGTA